MAEIWQNLFSLSALNGEDSFFDLGGDSIQLVQLFNKITQEILEPEESNRFYDEVSDILIEPTFDNIERVIHKIEKERYNFSNVRQSL